MIKYEEIAEFRKDLKRLVKRFSSLPEDLVVVKKNVIELRHVLGIDNLGTFEIPGMPNIWKVKKFACKSLKGRGNKSGIRVIYDLRLSEHRVVLLEIYFKGDKVNEDRERIRAYLAE